MRFLFDRLSLFVLFVVFISLTVFGFLMSEGDIDTGWDASGSEPADMMVVNVTERNIATFPEATMYLWEYDWDNSTFETYEWTMWESSNITVNTLDVDFSFQSIFPDLFGGYNNVQTELTNADAPEVLSHILIIFPLAIMFIAIRSIVVSW